jgi:large subunit ribosomal protein L5
MSSYTPVLKKLYAEQVVPALVQSRGYKNKHEVPRLVKVNLNTGIDAEADKNQIADTARDMATIAGQKPVLAKTRKAISNFKLKPNQVVGCHVTLRGDAMWEFLYRLLAVALPTSASPTSRFSPRSPWKTSRRPWVSTSPSSRPPPPTRRAASC